MRYLQQSIEEFESFAAMDHPDVPDDPISALQVRLYRWQVNNFGIQPLDRMVLGVIEESGELADATTPEDREDAIGDICVYAAQACTMARLGFRYVLAEANGVRPKAIEEYFQVGLSGAGRLSHTALKNSQNIRGMGDKAVLQERLHDQLSKQLAWASWYGDHSLEQIFSKVADQVMKRNWNANPETGAV